MYTPKHQGRGHSEETKEMAIKLYMEGNSSRAVGKNLGIGKNMCLYWIHQRAKHYYSNLYSAYSEILYYGKYTSLKDKSQTYTVEGANSDIKAVV